MFGLSMDQLRVTGEKVRHQHGFNRCVRCRAHFIHQPINSSSSSASSSSSLCRVHTQPAALSSKSPSSLLIHACCQSGIGSAGCIPTSHLPLYEQSTESTKLHDDIRQVDSTRRIDYTGMDIHVGQWM